MQLGKDVEVLGSNPHTNKGSHTYLSIKKNLKEYWRAFNVPFKQTDVMTCFTCCFAKKPASPPKGTIDIEEEISSVQNVKLYSYRELRVATEDFSPANKIGEGGFGSVYKGRLKDGILVAVKVLSADSRQGAREFLTELTVISDVEHENLVKLYGCCVEKDHRILVYGYLENNSLARTLLGGNHSSMQFNWSTRTKICIGVAQGLAYLHEEVEPYIVHRDIKASNILLDKDLTPKISDFGLAKLFPSHLTHISTRIAGTQGYLAPEYAIRGQLTRKADIYSFGVLLLEIVCGRCNQNKQLPVKDQYLLERVWELYRRGELVELVDTALNGDFDIDETCKYLKIGLLCTQNVPKNRPSMSTIVKMLRGEMDINEKNISSPGLMSEFMGLKRHNNDASDTSSSASRKQDDASLSGNNTTMTYATMTFTSISDRST